MSLLDQQDLAELSLPDYPGERLIACRNPYPAAERARMREDLLQATEKLLTAIAGQVSAGRVSGAGKIDLRARRIVNKHEVAKHLIPDVGDHHLTWHRDQAAIGAEAALDGIYVIRTSVPASHLDVPPRSPPTRTSREERDFRSLKADDLDLRPIHHRLEDRVRGHMLICMLAACFTWHLRYTWAPLTFADE